MRVFVGYGYNERDAWIETHVFPILDCLGFTVVHGKDMHGEALQPTIVERISQSDVSVGFFTLREGAPAGGFNSHHWVSDELNFANGKGIPILPVVEAGVNMTVGLLGNRQYIPLDQADRLACVKELLLALGNRNIRLLKLNPESDALRRDLAKLMRQTEYSTRYRVQDERGVESAFRTGRLERRDQSFYLVVMDVPRKSYVEVEGILNGSVVFSSGWASADAVHVDIS